MNAIIDAFIAILSLLLWTGILWLVLKFVTWRFPWFGKPILAAYTACLKLCILGPFRLIKWLFTRAQSQPYTHSQRQGAWWE